MARCSRASPLPTTPRSERLKREYERPWTVSAVSSQLPCHTIAKGNPGDIAGGIAAQDVAVAVRTVAFVRRAARTQILDRRFDMGREAPRQEAVESECQDLE